jgi:hypothetical protein
MVPHIPLRVIEIAMINHNIVSMICPLGIIQASGEERDPEGSGK